MEETEKTGKYEKKFHSADPEDSKNQDDDDKFHWKSSSQHVIFFLMYVLDWDLLAILFYEDGVKTIKHEPNFIHMGILLVFFGGPVLFLDNFIGHYTQNGSFVIGEMWPVAYGFGYLVVITSMLNLVIHVYYAHMLLFYLFATFCNARIPWLVCYGSYVGYVDTCFDSDDIEACPTRSNASIPCFQPGTRILAPVLFMESLGMYGNKPYTEVHKVLRNEFRELKSAVFHSLLIFVFILLFSVRKFKHYEATIRISAYFCFAGILTMTLMGFAQPGAKFVLFLLKPDFSLEMWVNIEIWSAAFRRIIEGLKLAEVGHVIFGSFISPKNLATHRSMALTCSFGIVVLYLTLLYKLFIGLLFHKLNLTMSDLELESEESLIFVVFPLVLGIQAFRHLFCFIYFLIMAIISFCSMTLKIVTIEKTISLKFHISSYYAYIRFFIGVIVFFTSFLIIFLPNKQYFYAIEGELKKSMVGILGIKFVILYVYGIQRFSDDFEFFFHSKVFHATFLKFCWLMAPVFCLIEFSRKLELNDTNTSFFGIIFLIVYTVPVLFSGIYIVVVQVKKKNLIGLIKSLDTFGPPEIEQRIVRVLFNPRHVVKYVNIGDVCFHKCRRQKSALDIAVGEEIKLLEKLIIEIETSEEDTGQNAMIIYLLKNHLKILTGQSED